MKQKAPANQMVKQMIKQESNEEVLPMHETVGKEFRRNNRRL